MRTADAYRIVAESLTPCREFLAWAWHRSGVGKAAFPVGPAGQRLVSAWGPLLKDHT